MTGFISHTNEDAAHGGQTNEAVPDFSPEACSGGEHPTRILYTAYQPVSKKGDVAMSEFQKEEFDRKYWREGAITTHNYSFNARNIHTQRQRD